jgi:hypothetical protein
MKHRHMKCGLACLLSVSCLAVPSFVSAAWSNQHASQPSLIERDALVYVGDDDFQGKLWEGRPGGRSGQAPGSAGYQTEHGGLVDVPKSFNNEEMTLGDSERGRDMTPSIDLPGSVQGHKGEKSSPWLDRRETADPAVEGLRDGGVSQPGSGGRF